MKAMPMIQKIFFVIAIMASSGAALSFLSQHVSSLLELQTAEAAEKEHKEIYKYVDDRNKELKQEMRKNHNETIQLLKGIIKKL